MQKTETTQRCFLIFLHSTFRWTETTSFPFFFFQAWLRTRTKESRKWRWHSTT